MADTSSTCDNMSSYKETKGKIPLWMLKSKFYSYFTNFEEKEVNIYRQSETGRSLVLCLGADCLEETLAQTCTVCG